MSTGEVLGPSPDDLPETFPGIRNHFSNTLPTRVTGMIAGQDVLIGEFQGGVILHGQTLVDILSRDIIAIYDIKTQRWVVSKGRRVEYQGIHIHPREVDA